MHQTLLFSPDKLAYVYINIVTFCEYELLPGEA